MPPPEQALPSHIFNQIATLGLNWTKAQKQSYLDAIRTIRLPRLDVSEASKVEKHPTDEPYLHRDDFLTQTLEAKAAWEAYWEETYFRKPTARAARQSVVISPPSRWKYIVPPNESVIVRDQATDEIVLVVLRNLVPHGRIASGMRAVCMELAKKCPIERQDDPGTLVHFAYTCGSRQSLQIQLATPKRGPTMSRHFQLQNDAQGVAGLLWNMLRCRLPDEIIDDFNATIDRHDLPRMDMLKAPDTSFTVKLEGQYVRFQTGFDHGLELPPPSGLIGCNYARYTHNEVNANEWAIGYVVHAPDDHSKGGNFYLAQYGVLLLPASNSVWSWKPTDYHGTTLFEMTDVGENHSIGCSERRVDGDYNVGMIFEISKALPLARQNTAWLPRTIRTPLPARPANQGKPTAAKDRSHPRRTAQPPRGITKEPAKNLHFLRPRKPICYSELD